MAGQTTSRVVFQEGDGETVVRRGTVLLAAALDAGIDIAAPCGGHGTCGKCTVVVSGDVSPPSRDEARLLGPDLLGRGVRLACRTRVVGDVVVTIMDGAGSGTGRGSSILSRAAVTAPFGPDPSDAVTGARSVGAALDIGTTTLVANLVDLATGDVLASAAALDPLAAHGADVLSRISHDAVQPGAQHVELVSAIVALLDEAASSVGLDRCDIERLAAVGNPAMVAFLLGEDPAPLGQAPYEGARIEVLEGAADPVLTGCAREARLYVPPAISPFVGPDVTAGLLATAFAHHDDAGLYADLGTNGEMVLRTPDGMWATSTAAGPAFEGASIESGMRAERGAIEDVRLVGDTLETSVIGDVGPQGICGSGLISLVAALLDAGVISPDGAFARGAGPLHARVRNRGDQLAFSVDDATGLVLTQKDVRQLQLAKGAVHAGVVALLDRAGVRASDIAETIVAGGFGDALDPVALERIGALPPGMASAARPVGNAAVEGARALLISTKARTEAERIVRDIRPVDLAREDGFADSFVASLDFP